MYKNGVWYKTLSINSINITGLLPSTFYGITGRAKDPSNNLSGLSNTLIEKTSGTDAPGAQVRVYTSLTSKDLFIRNIKFPALVSIKSGEGNLMYESMVYSVSTYINVSNWPKGIYIVKVGSGKDGFSKKIVIQ